MRAKCEIDESKGGTSIVVTELPYQVSPAAVLSRIKDLVDARELDGIRDLDDLSAGDDTKLVVSLKRDANANVVLNNLYKYTTLQTSFGVNMVALVDGVPRTLNLAQMLAAYVDHQVEVIRRRSEFRLDRAQKRAHVVEGRIKALDHIDAIIALIRGSEDRAAAAAGLMAKPFEFTEIQAADILDMRLAQLTRLGRADLEKEMAELRETIAELQSILNDPVKLRGVIKTELGEIREKFAEPRRSEITFDPGDLDVLDLIEDEEIVVVLSNKGYIKTVAADAFRRQGRGGKGVAGAKLKDEDWVEHLLTTTAHSYLLFFSNRGRVYRLRAHEIPMKERTARGTALVNLIALQPDERIQAVIDTRTYEEGSYLFFATKHGVVKKTKMSEYDSSLRTGLIAINLRDDDELVRVVQTTGNDSIFMVSRNGMTIRFSEGDVRAMGRATAGVRGMKLKNEDDAVVSCDVARDDSEILFVTKGGYGKRTRLERFNTQGRGGQGVRGMKVTPQRGEVVASFMVGAEDEILVFSSAGNIIRMDAGEISAQGRDATGVRVARVQAGESVVAVAPVLDTGAEE
jgi:DNA gyrase subunit A